jgi:hypothetical protein
MELYIIKTFKIHLEEAWDVIKYVIERKDDFLYIEIRSDLEKGKTIEMFPRRIQTTNENLIKKESVLSSVVKKIKNINF